MQYYFFINKNAIDLMVEKSNVEEVYKFFKTYS